MRENPVDSSTAAPPLVLRTIRHRPLRALLPGGALPHRQHLQRVLRGRPSQAPLPVAPDIANALAAYEVHTVTWGRWRAVLGIRLGAATTKDTVKKQYRWLSLLVHPDKARSCAAAEGAFKLLR